MCPDSDPYCGDPTEPEPETSWWYGLMDLLFDVNNDGDGGFWNWGAFGFFSNDEVSDESLLKGLNIYKGQVTHQGVADTFSLEYTAPEEAIR